MQRSQPRSPSSRLNALCVGPACLPFPRPLAGRHPRSFPRTSNPEFILKMPQWHSPSNENPARFPLRFPSRLRWHATDLPEPAGTERNSNRRPRRESVRTSAGELASRRAPRVTVPRASPRPWAAHAPTDSSLPKSPHRARHIARRCPPSSPETSSPSRPRSLSGASAADPPREHVAS